MTMKLMQRRLLYLLLLAVAFQRSCVSCAVGGREALPEEEKENGLLAKRRRERRRSLSSSFLQSEKLFRSDPMMMTTSTTKKSAVTKEIRTKKEKEKEEEQEYLATAAAFVLPESLEHLFEKRTKEVISFKNSTEEEEEEEKEEEPANFNNSHGNTSTAEMTVTIQLEVLLAREESELVVLSDLKAAYELWNRVWLQFVQDNIILDNNLHYNNSNITQVELLQDKDNENAAKVLSIDNTECPDSGTENGKETEQQVNTNEDGEDDNEWLEDTAAYLESLNLTATYTESPHLAQIVLDDDWNCHTLSLEYTVNVVVDVVSDLLLETTKNILFRYTKRAIEQGNLQQTLLAIDSDSSWIIIGPTEDFQTDSESSTSASATDDRHNNETMTIETTFDIIYTNDQQTTSGMNDTDTGTGTDTMETNLLLSAAFEKYVEELLNILTRSGITPVSGQVGGIAPEASIVGDDEDGIMGMIGPGGSFGVDPCLLDPESAVCSNNIVVAAKTKSNDHGRHLFLQSRQRQRQRDGLDISLIPNTTQIVNISGGTNSCLPPDSLNNNSTATTTYCETVKAQLELRLGQDMIPTPVYHEVSFAINDNYGLLQDMLEKETESSNMTLPFSIGNISLSGYTLSTASNTPAESDTIIDTDVSINTMPPTTADTQVVWVNTSFLVENSVGITASYMSTVSDESPNKRRLIETFRAFVEQIVYIDVVETDTTVPVTRRRLLYGRDSRPQRQRRLEVVFDPTSTELYRYSDASCPSIAATTSKQQTQDDEEEDPPTSCFAAYGKFRLFLGANEDVEQVYRQYYETLQSAIEDARLQEILEKMFPSSQLRILVGLADQLDTQFVPYDGYIPETLEPTLSPTTASPQEEEEEATTDAPPSGGTRSSIAIIPGLAFAVLLQMLSLIDF